MLEIHIISINEKLMQKCNKELSGGETCHSYFLLIGCILLKCIVVGVDRMEWIILDKY